MSRSTILAGAVTASLAIMLAGCSSNSGSLARKGSSGNPASALAAAPRQPAKSGPSFFGRMKQAFQKSVASSERRSDRPWQQTAYEMPADDPISLAKKPTQDADLFVVMARAQEVQNNLPGAEKLYQKALSLEERHRDALVGYARLLDRKGDADGAVRLYQKALRFYGDDATLLNDMALCCARHERMPDAMAALSRAVHLEPTSKRYRNNFATVLVDVGQNEEALRHLRAVHNEAEANYNLGYLLAHKEDYAASRRYFARALELKPNLKAARAWMNHLAAKSRRSPAAGQDAPHLGAAQGRPQPVDDAPTFVTPDGLAQPERLPPVDGGFYYPPSRY